MTSLRIAAVLLLAGAGGCTTTDSDFVRTSGMWARIDAVASGGSTVVDTSLYVGEPDGLKFIKLTGGDRLIASHGTQDTVMAQFEFLNIVVHRATFPTEAEDAEFVVDFQRDADPGAPASIATLPPPYEVTAAQSYSRAQALDVTWSPVSGDQMSWQLDGNCIESVRANAPVADTGALTIPAGMVRKREDQQGQPPVPDSCQVTLRLSRLRDGAADPAFLNDEVEAEFGPGVFGEQRREVEVTSTP